MSIVSLKKRNGKMSDHSPNDLLAVFEFSKLDSKLF